MNLDRYFSVPLFREGLRRLALPAAGLGIAVLLINLYILFSGFPSDDSCRGYDDYPYGLQLCPALIWYMMLAPLLLGLWQFRFLNHKDGVDFFLAAPATRAALFNAFSLAGLVLQWLTVIVVVVAGALLFHGYGVRLHLADVVHAIFTCGVGAFFGWAITACAIAVCSGALAPMAIAAMACLVPGILQFGIGVLLNQASLSTFVWPQAFAVTDNLFIDVFVNGPASGGARTLVFTLALAAGYYLLGVYAFARRQAESGGHPGVIYPALAAAALFLAVLTLVFVIAVIQVDTDWDTRVVSWKMRWSTSLAWECVMLVLGFYTFAYALFRRLRPLLLSTLLLPLAALATALAIFGALSWGERFRKAVPAAEEVTAVTFLQPPFPRFNDDASDVAGLRTTDPLVCQRAAASLASWFKSSENIHSRAEGRYAVRLELRNGTFLARWIPFRRQETEPSLWELLMADPANAAYWRLPEAGQTCGFTVQIGWGTMYRQHLWEGWACRGDEPQWAAFRQEYAAAIASAPAAVASWKSCLSYSRSQSCIKAKFRNRHGRIVEMYFPIIPRLMPKTRDWLLEIANCQLPILSQGDREHAFKFEFHDLDALGGEDQSETLSDSYCSDFSERLAALQTFLAPIQARQIAPGEKVKHHLAHCKLVIDQPLFEHQKDGLGDVKREKNFFLFMTPEEIAKLRGLLGKE
ncbi:MAG: hypothetical protein J6333_11190 [Planctomycetes bacterium]|nr:hypothetical protein [Planctomycetota bacterium]